MEFEEGAGAESPKDADAGELGVAGGLHIDVAVAYIDGIGTAHAKLTQCLEYGVGGRFLAQAFCFVLPNGDFNGVGKEMAAEVLGGCIEFVAYNSYMFAATSQFGQ